MINVLFVCSRNRRRSPTAERVFGNDPQLDVASAGLAPDAEEPVTADLLAWAQLIVVMEKAHRRRLQRRFGPDLRHARVVCLDIPDAYDFMNPALVDLLRARVGPHLRRGPDQRKR